MSNQLSISVVIPAYNEEKLIGDCLDALDAQTRQPDEIIIVDNNCTDATIDIIKARNNKRITVVQEPRQGITYARTAGFDAATSDIIARIDVDSIVHTTWVENIAKAFSNHPTAIAVTGNAAVAELSPKGRFWATWYYTFFRTWHQRSMQISPILYGFNSALRKTAWEKIRHKMSLGDAHISEDVDVTCALMTLNEPMLHIKNILVKCHVLRSVDTKKLARYYQTDNYTLTKYKIGNKKRWENSPQDTDTTQ